MNVRYPSPGTKTPAKLCILLMDANSERRALRIRILTLRGVEVVGVCNLLEANAIWNHERYDICSITRKVRH